MTMISLVPRLRPAIDGVGDYGFNLALQIRKDYNISTQFIVGDPTWQRHNELEDMEVKVVLSRSADNLVTHLQDKSTVILHYVPHGYARKACPFWLIQGLERWHKSTANARLITMFHELYALDWHRPWSSDFYLSPVQQSLAARVAQLSDACLTSTERYRPIIQRFSQGRHTHIPVLPVPSNMGEPSKGLPLWQRQRRLILFGQRRSKNPIYQYSQALLSQICQALEIEEIWDIGPSVELAPTHIGPVLVKQLGTLSETDISHMLSDSLAGFLSYDPKRLGKSGIFAAYCAHGMVPINHTYTHNSTDGLIANQHYWCPTLKTSHGPDIKAIVGHAFAWYQNHALSKQAAVFHGTLPNVPLSATADEFS